MSDEISVNMNVNLGKDKTVDDIVTVLREHLKRPEMMHTTHWDGCMESHTICALAWSLDEIERLREKIQDLRAYAEQDACQIERLQKQVALAHSILASEPMIWLAGGTSNHEMAHWDTIMPAIKEYWNNYGNVFRPLKSD